MIYAAAGAQRSLLLLIPAAIFRGMAIIYFYVQTAAATTTGRRQLYHTHTHTLEQRYIFFWASEGQTLESMLRFLCGSWAVNSVGWLAGGGLFVYTTS